MATLQFEVIHFHEAKKKMFKKKENERNGKSFKVEDKNIKELYRKVLGYEDCLLKCEYLSEKRFINVQWNPISSGNEIIDIRD